MTRLLQATIWLACLLTLAFALTGCSGNTLLASATFQPATITPNGDGQADATQIDYALNRDAKISIFLQDAAGKRYYFRQGQPRTAGPYSVLFGGVIDNRALANGTYT